MQFLQSLFDIVQGPARPGPARKLCAIIIFLLLFFTKKPIKKKETMKNHLKFEKFEKNCNRYFSDLANYVIGGALKCPSNKVSVRPTDPFVYIFFSAFLITKVYIYTRHLNRSIYLSLSKFGFSVAGSRKRKASFILVQPCFLPSINRRKENTTVASVGHWCALHLS